MLVGSTHGSAALAHLINDMLQGFSCLLDGGDSSVIYLLCGMYPSGCAFSMCKRSSTTSANS